MRPCKWRQIAGEPRIHRFKPCGIPPRESGHVSLTLDELEAVRLADLLGLYQEEAASRMNVSRQTFGNIVHAARAKIADALVNARMLKIEGGSVQLAARRFRCGRCHARWQEEAGAPRSSCPECRSPGTPDDPRGRSCCRSRMTAQEEPE